MNDIDQLMKKQNLELQILNYALIFSFVVSEQ